jgi:hypothetical protein
VDYENLLVDHVADRQVTEELRKQVVDFDIVLVLDFSLEPIHLV